MLHLIRQMDFDMDIVAHELLPGHHFQANLIAEKQSLPELNPGAF